MLQLFWRFFKSSINPGIEKSITDVGKYLTVVVNLKRADVVGCLAFYRFDQSQEKIKKDPRLLEEALTHLRDMRDIWKEEIGRAHV